MFNSRVIQLITVLLCGGLILLSAMNINSINEGRKELNMWGPESPIENAPPEYALAIQALGAFRGLITDIAFIRAERLKEEGRFYDAMQLAKWICALQPRFPSVWEFAAWNMSWNISVTTFTPQERWNWVYNGVKLLRDQGIPANPRAVNLYKQLAWTFNNKMSEPTDEQHYAYKCEWAWRMHLVLGKPPAPFEELQQVQNLAAEVQSISSVDQLAEAGAVTFAQNEEERRALAEAMQRRFPEAAAEAESDYPALSEAEQLRARIRRYAVRDRMQRIAAAPHKLDGLYEAQPAARAIVAALRKLGIDISDARLSEDTYWRDDGLAFEFFQPYRRLKTDESLFNALRDDAGGGTERSARMQRIAEILDIAGGDDTPGAAVVRFLQSKVLREVYKLEPEHMVYLIDQFGPMDWRSVDSQSLYWVSQGLIAGGESVHQFKHDKTNTTRLIFFSLRNLWHRNNIVFEPNPRAIYDSYLNLSRDPAFIEPMHQAYIRYGRLFEPEVESLAFTEGAGQTFRTGHINFLTEIIRELYLSGYDLQAAYYYHYLQETYPTNSIGEPNPALQKTLKDFVMDSFLEEIQFASLRDITSIVNGFLTNAYNELAEGDVERYVATVRKARDLYDNYMQEKLSEGGWDRVMLPDFSDMMADAFGAWFQTPPVSPAETIHKVRLWRAAPLLLRQAVYDALLPLFRAEAEHWGFALDRTFPEPPGMEAFRAAHPTSERRDSRSGAETGEVPVDELDQ
jgi:hypothetical protein